MGWFRNECYCLPGAMGQMVKRCGMVLTIQEGAELADLISTGNEGQAECSAPGVTGLHL